jgi:hypothetical protein
VAPAALAALIIVAVLGRRWRSADLTFSVTE